MSAGDRRAVAARFVMVAFCASVTCACGYAPVRSAQRGFCVQSAESRSADAIAAGALAAGVREGLASTGALGTCPPAQRVRVEIVRITSSPFAAVEGQERAVARGLQVSVLGRATVEGEDEAWTTESEGETSIEVLDLAVSAAQTEADARARAARQAGQMLAARLSGLPSPTRAAGDAR